MAESSANPAHALLALLSQWNVPNGPVGAGLTPPTGSRVRHVGDEQAESLPAWRQQATAVRLVVEIDGQLRALRSTGKPVDKYLSCVPRWYQAAFAFTTEWHQSGQRNVLATGDRDLLEVLSAFMDETTLVGAVADPDIKRIRTAIHEAEEVVRSASELPASLRRYILGLFAEAADALDDAEYGRPGGQVNLRRATTQLNGLLNQAADELPGSSRLGAQLRQAAAKISGFAVSTVVAAALSAGTTHYVDNRLGGNDAPVLVQLPPAPDAADSGNGGGGDVTSP